MKSACVGPPGFLMHVSVIGVVFRYCTCMSPWNEDDVKHLGWSQRQNAAFKSSYFTSSSAGAKPPETRGCQGILSGHLTGGVHFKSGDQAWKQCVLNFPVFNYQRGLEGSAEGCLSDDLQQSSIRILLPWLAAPVPVRGAFMASMPRQTNSTTFMELLSDLF